MYNSEIQFSEILESPGVHTVGQIIENEVFRFDAVGRGCSRLNKRNDAL